jgi:cytoskeletal protein CcmA (bactofilin family)
MEQIQTTITINEHGVQVPPIVITSDYVLTGVHNVPVIVEAGKLQVTGTVNGSLRLSSNTTTTIKGTVNGSVHLENASTVIVTGSLNGSLHTNYGATAIVERTGKLAGSIHNEGTIIIRGVFGGSGFGSGELRYEDGGYEKQPTTITADGTRTYNW